MVTINIKTDASKYSVTDNGEVVFILTDTANAYADGKNPSRSFSVKPVGNTMADLNRSLLLAKEEAIDYFRGEAEKIERRQLIETGMAQTTIPDIIFTGDPETYQKLIKIGASNEELIIKDTIVITPFEPNNPTSNIYNVTAEVMQPTENRSKALPVSIVWNKNSGYAKLKELLIINYRSIKNPTTDWLQGEIKNNIGIDIPK